MRAREERQIVLTMSPKERRALADKMEKKYKKLGAGEGTIVDLVHTGQDFTIAIHLDQEYFIKEEKREKRWIPERGSGHDGFRCRDCGEWVYKEDLKECECDSK